MQPHSQIPSPLFDVRVNVIFLQAQSKKINFSERSLCARGLIQKPLRSLFGRQQRVTVTGRLTKKINKHTYTHTAAQFVYLPDINCALLIIFGCAPAGPKRGQKRTELVAAAREKYTALCVHAAASSRTRAL
jgi:hypothetical protein